LGDLEVFGSSKADVIVIDSSGEHLTVDLNGQHFEFPLVRVQQISVISGDGNDVVTNNTFVRAEIDGGTGNDVLTGGFSADSLAGGDGFNWLDSQTDELIVDYRYSEFEWFNFNSDLFNDVRQWYWAASNFDGGSAFDVFQRVPTSVKAILTSGDDQVIGDAQDYPGSVITVEGRGGNDQFADLQTSSLGPGPAIALIGGEGDDRFVIQGRVDSILGGAGDDYIDDRTFIPAQSDVFVDLGEGYDIHDASAENFNGTGEEVFRAYAGVEELHGPTGAGNYTLLGNELDNVLTSAAFEGVTILGGDGNDTIRTLGGGGNARHLLKGGEGDDLIDAFGTDFGTLLGESGDDTLLGGVGPDILDGGDGNDVLIGEQFPSFNMNDTLIGGEGNDYLDGVDGHDLLSGGDGNDTLFGGEGNDHLDGGDGRDQLFGGPGDDTLLGGPGGDLLVGGPGNEVIDGGGGRDFILDIDNKSSRAANNTPEAILHATYGPNATSTNAVDRARRDNSAAVKDVVDGIEVFV